MTQVVASEFAEFYTTHFARIARQLAAYLGDHAEAQDVTQEAFCRALDRWGAVSRFADPPAWVRRVAWNLATSRLRHLRVRARHLAGEREEYIDGPEPDRVALTRALAALPPNQRVAVVLFHLGELSTVEIAEQQGVPEGTVRSWLTRGRSRLAELLADAHWEDLGPASPPPAGIQAARRSVRRRRAARGVAATLAALALAVTAVIVLRGKMAEPPIIGPTDAPTKSDTVPTRRIGLPGVGNNTPPLLRFVDRTHAWVLFDTCYVVQNNCRRVLGKTGDSGRTWQTVPIPPLPDAPGDAVIGMAALDANTMTLVVNPRPGPQPRLPYRYLLTRDGGATFTSYPGSAPPLETQLATPGMYCTGMSGSTGTACDNLSLVRAGLSPQSLPAGWPAASTTAVKGGDGRIWLMRGRTDATEMMVSADSGKTWKSLPWPEFGGSFHPSPDGKDIWVTSRHRMYQLVGEQWQLRYTLVDPDTTSGLVYLGDGLWFGKPGANFGYWRDGTFAPMALQIPDAHESQLLRDATVVIPTAEGAYVGANGEWVYIAR
jgi:RNA polymerase sigma-70 factor (ECF subfamily)